MERLGAMSVEQPVRLRIHSGVPIVDVLGDWVPHVTDAVSDLVRTLTESGHFDIVLNVQRAAITGISALSSLSRLAKTVRSHCGHIDVVGTKDQVNELIRSRVETLFRLAMSEEAAIGRIKRTPVLAAAQEFTARP